MQKLVTDILHKVVVNPDGTVTITDPSPTSTTTKPSTKKSSSPPKKKSTASTGPKAPKKGDDDAYWSYLLSLGIRKDRANAIEKALVAAAVASKVTVDLGTFDRWLRVRDTRRYLRTTKGRNEVRSFREHWGAWFGTQKPTIKTFMRYMKEGWTPGTRETFFRTTAAYKNQYVKRGINLGLQSLRNNPAEFQRWWERYSNIYKRYNNGRLPANAQAKLFFGGKQSLEEYEQNAQAVYGGSEWLARAQGRTLTAAERNKALYNAAGEDTRQRILKAYQMRKQNEQAQQASFGSTLDESGRLVQRGL